MKHLLMVILSMVVGQSALAAKCQESAQLETKAPAVLDEPLNFIEGVSKTVVIKLIGDVTESGGKKVILKKGTTIYGDVVSKDEETGILQIEMHVKALNSKGKTLKFSVQSADGSVGLKTRYYKQNKYIVGSIVGSYSAGSLAYFSYNDIKNLQDPGVWESLAGASAFMSVDGSAMFMAPKNLPLILTVN